MKQNYQKMLEETIAKNQREERVPFPCCCIAAVRRAALIVWSICPRYFKLSVFYYNPNIYPEEEYTKRVAEQQHFIERLPAKYPISFVEGTYDKESFYEMARGLEDVKEGGERCFRCYELRLRESAELAKELHMDYFTTTLSISPLKNAEKLNEIGDRLSEEYGIAYLNSDFKKKNGYKRSVELSEEYGMYRQYYCGCVFSKRERDAQIAAKAAAGNA